MFSLHIPHLNWPYPEPLPPLHTPGLNRLLRFGRYQARPQTGAAYCFEQLGIGLGSLYHEPYAFASPVWQQAGMHSVQLLGAAALVVQPDEAEVLCHGLNALYEQDGWRFAPLHPDLWTVCLPRPADWGAPCVLDALGQADGTQRPQGRQQTQWLQRQTEIQMWLHSHPVNTERQANGRPPINGLWLWDMLPDTPPPAPPALLGSDSLWAQYSRTVTTAAPYDWAAWQAVAAEAAVPLAQTALFLDDLSLAVSAADAYSYAECLQQWDARFFTPLWQALQQGSLSQLRLSTDGEHGGECRVEGKTGWQFWRRKKVFAGRLL